jgi:hypothetical protein
MVIEEIAEDEATQEPGNVKNKLPEEENPTQNRIIKAYLN